MGAGGYISRIISLDFTVPSSLPFQRKRHTVFCQYYSDRESPYYLENISKYFSGIHMKHRTKVPINSNDKISVATLKPSSLNSFS